MNRRRKLPIGGVQTFSELRREYDVYVDKTMHVYELASRYKTVFLARPRRFGKSLMCSTIASLFRAEKEFFDGLAIAQTDWEWKPHPVIHLDLGSGNYTDNGVGKLIDTLNTQLDNVCHDYGIPVENSANIANRFDRIITELSNKSDGVVVLVDEYDNPLMNTVSQPELNAKLREELKGFYSVMKKNGKYLRFAFITGVTKFAQISMFSGMNQPKDISMMPEYCDVCGITQDELEKYFAPEIDAYAPKHGGRESYLNRLKDFYNGYFFTERKLSVYNTYGILNHFDEDAEFVSYLSTNETSSYVQDILKIKDINSVEIENSMMTLYDFCYSKDNTVALIPFLYNTGYLTISDYKNLTDYVSYFVMNFPNVEVRRAFAELVEKI